MRALRLDSDERRNTIVQAAVPLFAGKGFAGTPTGDIAAAAGPPENRFWFAQHVAAMMAFAALPPKGCVPYRGTPEQVAAEATKFILRGIGMTAAAIAAHRDGHNSPQLAAD